MTEQNPADQVIVPLLNGVERLCERVEALEKEHKECKNQIESYILRIEDLEDENEELNERVQSLRLQLSDFAGNMEQRLKNIREEARNLPVNNINGE